MDRKGAESDWPVRWTDQSSIGLFLPCSTLMHCCRHMATVCFDDNWRNVAATQRTLSPGHLDMVFHSFLPKPSSTRRSPQIPTKNYCPTRLNTYRYQPDQDCSIDHPRSNMINFSDPSNYPVAVFLCIFGVAGGVLLAWASLYYFGRLDEPDVYTIPTEQAIYMRETRLRNLRDVAAVLGR